MTFLSGDRFFVEERGHQGTIEAVKNDTYLVRWDSFPTKVWDYKIEETKDMWKPVSTNCPHDLKEYIGFSESYIYCTKCGKK